MGIYTYESNYLKNDQSIKLAALIQALIHLAVICECLTRAGLPITVHQMSLSTIPVTQSFT